MTTTTKADPRIFVILGIFSLIFAGIGTYVLFKQSDGWKVLLFILGFLALFWAGAVSIRFHFDDSAISYRSLFRRLTIATETVRGIEIVAERRNNSPQGVPTFYLTLNNGKREQLNVRVLPIRAVKALCRMLTARGVTVSTEDAFVAKRMSSQIFDANS